MAKKMKKYPSPTFGRRALPFDNDPETTLPFEVDQVVVNSGSESNILLMNYY